MSNGTTVLLPVASDEQFTPISVDDCYFQIALHAAQVFVALPGLSQTTHLVCSTEVGSTFLPDHYVRSIHKVETVQKNRPCPLGLSVVLTDWMPAIADKTIRVSLKLVAVRDKPFGKLTDTIEQLDLSSALSLLAPQIGTGIKIATIVGKMLGTILEEGATKNVLELAVDLPVHDMRAGYWAVIAPDTSGDRPIALHLRPGGLLDDPKAPFSERNTYAVLKVRARERRGPEAARATAWWSTLQDGLRQVRRLAPPAAEKDRRKANGIWLDTLERAERLAEEDRSFLLSEIRQIFQVHEQGVQRMLHPPTVFEATGGAAFSEERQRLLGVRDEAELDRAVASYQQALARAAADEAAT